VNAQNKRGFTALMGAALMGHTAVVATLLKAGASVKATLPEGWSALALAKSKGHGAVVALLEKA
jgi:ankyrin repeat protein